MQSALEEEATVTILPRGVRQEEFDRVFKMIEALPESRRYCVTMREPWSFRELPQQFYEPGLVLQDGIIYRARMTKSDLHELMFLNPYFVHNVVAISYDHLARHERHIPRCPLADQLRG